MVAAGAIAVLLAWLPPRELAARGSAGRGARARCSPAPSPGLAAIASAGSSSVSPELERLWLTKVREAMPI